MCLRYLCDTNNNTNIGTMGIPGMKRENGAKSIFEVTKWVKSF